MSRERPLPPAPHVDAELAGAAVSPALPAHARLPGFFPRGRRSRPIHHSSRSASLVTPEATTSDLQAVEALKHARERITTELRKVIVGQDQVVEQLLTALFANG